MGFFRWRERREERRGHMPPMPGNPGMPPPVSGSGWMPPVRGSGIFPGPGPQI